MVRTSFRAATLSALLFAAPLVAAQAPAERAFPFDLIGPSASPRGLELALRADGLAQCSAEARLVLTRVPLPDGGTLALELERLATPGPGLELRVDGLPVARARADAGGVVFAGHVRGEAGTDVLLALSQRGSRGWIRRASGLVHWLAAPGAGGDWTRARTFVVEESALARVGSAATCTPLTPSPAAGLPVVAQQAPQALGSNVTLHCRLAIETDYQLYAQFNDLAAEQTYLVQLLTAADNRYQLDMNTVLEPVYLGLHATPNDGWTVPDQLGTPQQLILEFQAAWQNNLPNGAHVAHFLSGAPLGGGTAYTDSLCNGQTGFAVSADVTLSSGLTPFPVAQGPMNWDFITLTHETAHNFGSPHTQDFCPPIDTCAPPTSGCGPIPPPPQQCISSGTLMSYCQLCPGGYANIDPVFHPLCAALMRQKAESSCLGAFAPGQAFCSGDGLDAQVTAQCPCGNFGAPGKGCANSFEPAGAALAGGGSPFLDNVSLTCSGMPASSLTLFIKFTAVLPGGVVNADGVWCAGGTLRRFGTQNAVGGVAFYPQAGQVPLSVVTQTSYGSGVTGYYQVFYRNASPTFCPPATANTSPAYRIVW